ncbi:Protein CBG24178 [Caenorhabditis briggsae]|uniref:Protein CBG24178 n=1 Tax=Caenorhabditis briggsae TaxID=6238 RepID=A8WK53_CAEBR|nr:Protein CBG24178 [Caenorhabditis briggsae]CAP20846.2 Protein CBG24178 [Caenorhabditis briggsae]
MKQFFLLLISVTVIHGCLRVRSPEPPKCECPSLAIDQQETFEIETHNFYQNISNQALEPPTIVLEDCSILMYCDPEFSLVVFDTEDAVMFGEYGIDGMCDPYTQTWMEDDGTQLRTFNRLYGACVGYGKCLCYSATINEENFDVILGNHPFKENISGYAIKDPYMNVEDCSVSFGCDEGYSLVMFNSNEAVMFGEYPADGFCDPTSQTWQVADETGSLRIFDKLYGACVDYETPAATEPPQLTCPCAYMDIVTSNAKEYIGHFDLYLKNLSHYDLVTPEEFIFSIRENGCVANYRCPAGTSRYFFWISINSKQNHRILTFLKCAVNLIIDATPLPNPDPPTSPMCSCDNYMLRASLDRTTLMNNFEVKSTVSDDHCHWEISCKNEAHAVVEVYGQKYFSQSLDAKCSPDSFRWNIQNSNGGSWSGIEIFNFGCTKQVPNAVTTQKPSGTPAPCFCLQIDFDSSNADQFIGTYDFYLYNISRYALYKPFLLYPGGRVSGCPMSFQCPEGEVQILTTSERSYEVRAVEMFCVDEMWTVIDGSDVTQLTRSVYMTCAYFSTPSTKNLPPLETMCNCPHKMRPNYLIPDNRILEPNFFITSTISNDRCVWEIQCGYPTNLKFNANGQEFSVSVFLISLSEKKRTLLDAFWFKNQVSRMILS